MQTASAPRRTDAAVLTIDDLTRLLEVVRSLNGVRTLSEVAALITEAVRRLVGADGATFVMKDGDLCHYLEENAVGPLWRGKRFPLTDCISGFCMLNAQTAAIPDIRVDPRIPQDAYRPTFVRSLVMTPLGRQHPVAALGAYWAVTRVPTGRELALLEALADATAIAVESATRHEQLTEALEDARLAAERREQFIQWLAHDLRNPLAAVALAARLLEPRVRTLSADSQAHLANLVEAAERMDRLIHDLLDLAAIDGARLSLRRQPLKIDEVVGSANEMRELVEQRGLTLVIEHAGPADVEVECDPDRVAQVLANLISNALQHAHGAKTIRVRGGGLGESAYFEVSDDGAGIPPARLGGLFARDPKRAAGSTGHGLGLSIARGLVEAHGGTIGARNGPERGAVFHFALPRRPAGEG